MAKRRDVVRLLETNGFVSMGGKKHEAFVHANGRMTTVPRHTEVNEMLFMAIKKQAGLK